MAQGRVSGRKQDEVGIQQRVLRVDSQSPSREKRLAAQVRE